MMNGNTYSCPGFLNHTETAPLKIFHAFFWGHVWAINQWLQKVSYQRWQNENKSLTFFTFLCLIGFWATCFWPWQLEERIERLSTELAKRKPIMLLHTERIQHLQTVLHSSGVSLLRQQSEKMETDHSVLTTWQERQHDVLTQSLNYLHLLIVRTALHLYLIFLTGTWRLILTTKWEIFAVIAVIFLRLNVNTLTAVRLYGNNILMFRTWLSLLSHILVWLSQSRKISEVRTVLHPHLKSMKMLDRGRPCDRWCVLNIFHMCAKSHFTVFSGAALTQYLFSFPVSFCLSCL